ncbi:VOC family protein, partial [Pleurocapsales cyanobacterium LEGE 10410]|nr:VOC family protein [Pleurocapsales cyanobacterium LEGE 10410]
MKIDHVHFYTRNAARTRDWFVQNVGFRAIGKSINRHTHTEIIALNSAFFVLSSPLSSASRVTQYLDSHPSGVVDIAFRVKDLSAVIKQANNLKLELQPPQTYQSSQGTYKYARVAGWNSLQHTLIEASTDPLDYCLPDCQIEHYDLDCFNYDTGRQGIQVVEETLKDRPSSVLSGNPDPPSNVTNIDHVVLNVAKDRLNSAVELYQALFGFKIQQSFNIKTEKSGLYSQALVDDSGAVQFNINEPTSANSQIQEFIDLNGGSGIQHLALRSHNLIADVAQMQQNGISFLKVPQSYYSKLNRLPSLSTEEWQAIATEQILVDSDRTTPQSLLMQIFTQPIFEQPTFSLEFI